MQVTQTEIQKGFVKEHRVTRPAARLAGYTAIGGCITMIIGAALWGTSGTDLWAALDSGDMAGYLAAVAGVKGQLVANLSIWIIGVLILGVAGNVLAGLSQQRLGFSQAAQVCYQVAVPLVIVSYIAMLSLVVQLAGDTSETAVAIGNVLGWVGTRADDLATALILGAGPLFITLANRSSWMPVWLIRWGYLSGLVGLFSVAVHYVAGMGAFGFLILPVGMGWMIATGIVLLRGTPNK
ncbi:hypothetical protein [Candidatus Leptofilum sp.]|uniref:hypothetical protein n=1 Tax=Candidatus Leptofilum sp. TaxID=3241576 RepID=UPI003B59F20A